MEITTDLESLKVIQALGNEKRLAIINLLVKGERNLSEIAHLLNISPSLVTKNIIQLEDAKIIKSRRVPGKFGLQKIVYLSTDTININFPERIFPKLRNYTTEIAIGHFNDFQAFPTCGLASENSTIGVYDDPRSFVDPCRIDAQLIWFRDGFLEYKIPNLIKAGDKVEFLEIVLELSSEFPVSNNVWPSDIDFTLNGTFLGTYHVQGNFSDVKGRLTPDWWPELNSQYGIQKHIRIYQYDTNIDGVPISSANLSSIGIYDSDFLTLRIAPKPSNDSRGGLTLFGEKWGNYPHHIKVTTYVEE